MHAIPGSADGRPGKRDMAVGRTGGLADPKRRGRIGRVCIGKIFIAVAVAEKIGAIETADEFLRMRAAKAKPADLMKFLRQAPNVKPAESDNI